MILASTSIQSEDPPKRDDPPKAQEKKKFKQQMIYLEVDTVTKSERLPDTLLLEQKKINNELDSLIMLKKEKLKKDGNTPS